MVHKRFHYGGQTLAKFLLLFEYTLKEEARWCHTHTVAVGVEYGTNGSPSKR